MQVHVPSFLQEHVNHDLLPTAGGKGKRKYHTPATRPIPRVLGRAHRYLRGKLALAILAFAKRQEPAHGPALGPYE